MSYKFYGEATLEQVTSNGKSIINKEYLDNCISSLTNESLISGKKYATLVIGNEDAGHTSNQVDFLVPAGSVSAQIQINAALSAAPVGGKIIILEGSYFTSDQIIIISKANQTIDGMGKGTILHRDFSYTSGNGVIVCTAQYDTIKNLVIQGHNDTYTETNTNHGVLIKNGGGNATISNVTIYNNNHGIYMMYSSNNTRIQPASATPANLAKTSLGVL
jgi:parallel beta-helix repeat protein